MASKARRNKAVWDDNKDKILIDSLLHQASQGRRAGNSFKPQAWSEVTTLLNDTFRPNIDAEQVKTRVRRVSTSLLLFLI